MPTARFPAEVRRLREERRLRITWQDGAVSEYPYDDLRGWCPCAECQGHASGEVRFHSVRSPVEPTTIRPVGNYGLSVAWSDGHGTGIYRFEFLWGLAPGRAVGS